MLVPLAVKARQANVQITIDAEECERLDISMDVLASLIAQPELQGWHGLGFVVQAYQRRALPLLNWLEHQAARLGAPLFVRLVKGAYWDSEIKRAQELGLESYPVYTRKEMTDLSYLACARKLLAHPDRFSPQFATHNAHSVSAIRELVGDDRPMEFQRLFGMGQQLHDTILSDPETTSRIYAPVGTQKDLLSYLIRRLLENGANSSFVNKLADPAYQASTLSQGPVSTLARLPAKQNANIPAPRDYLGKKRSGAEGWDLSNPLKCRSFERGLAKAAGKQHRAGPIIDGIDQDGIASNICNPAELSQIIGQIVPADVATAQKAIRVAHHTFPVWSGRSVKERADILNHAADLLEERAAIFHFLAIKEAGKTWSDAVDEVREAVDFCRYYAGRILTDSFSDRTGLGVVACISPWNFPLAIFLGQVVAALAAGNSVVAKPAEQTPLIAAEAIRLLLDAGVDGGAIAFVPGDGKSIGETLVADPLTASVCFTGSTATAKRIASRLAETGRSMAPLIAETGGINAMIVDSSALLEQTVDAVISSAFQSAGQRCSALRILCVQDDIADNMIDLLSGAMDALTMGDPNRLDIDVGPVIDQTARQNIQDHVDRLDQIAKRIGSTPSGNIPDGFYVAPAAFELNEFSDLDREIFGPVLHVVRFKARDRDMLVEQINASGYGLTMGIQSRIDNSCNTMAHEANVGNIYINRNQIGAVVGVQPFGGNGLSGTGPKAGGPLYLNRLSKLNLPKQTDSLEPPDQADSAPAKASQPGSPDLIIAEKAQKKLKQSFSVRKMLTAAAADPDTQLAAIIREELEPFQAFIATECALPSPAGETNAYTLEGRGIILLLLGNSETALRACVRAVITGNSVIQLSRDDQMLDVARINATLTRITGVSNLVQAMKIPKNQQLSDVLNLPEASAVVMDEDDITLPEAGNILAKRAGAIIPILSSTASWDRYVHEKTITDNIAAAGGDVTLLNA
ncbi:bifunctional proline dehydrogenase/L-glutamate gamma-semialdehyde dehydrogenase PutA, partial [Parasphingorhabdus sp.]